MLAKKCITEKNQLWCNQQKSLTLYQSKQARLGNFLEYGDCYKGEEPKPWPPDHQS